MKLHNDSSSPLAPRLGRSIFSFLRRFANLPTSPPRLFFVRLFYNGIPKFTSPLFTRALFFSAETPVALLYNPGFTRGLAIKRHSAILAIVSLT
jgi:hypothetical protein